MPSEYHLQSFWEQRFRSEPHFEWLGDGQETLIPRLRAFLRAEATREDRTPSTPRLLHIGAGNSTLSRRIREAYDEVHGHASWDESVIVNLDYSEAAVQNGQQAETVRTQGRGERSMRWVQADVLQWEDLAPLVDGEDGQDGDARAAFSHRRDAEPFAIVVDKSTSDAIACGEDIELTTSSRCHPAIQKYIASNGVQEARLDPVQLLALNLASLVRPGGVWIILSFSSSRASFLENHGPRDSGEDTDIMDPALYWCLEEHHMVDAPTGQSREGVYAPPVQHHLYVLRRSSTVFGLRSLEYKK